MADAPRVFLSYSHGSDEHADRVLALADALSRDGCTVLFDQYVFPASPDGWTAWMRQCLDPANCDFVLLVCTEGYRRRFEGREEPGAGRGVRREGRLIDSRLYEQDAQAARYIPILLDPADLRFVPRELFDHNRYVLRAFHIQDPGYEALYRHLTGQPATPAPQPGEVIILPPKPRGIDSEGEVRHRANPPRIFVSYSRKDRRWMEEFRDQIRPLIRGGHIDAWEDSQIAPGQEWHKEITKAIEVADIAVLLVSPDFLASDFIANEELPSLLAGRKTVFWIAIRHSNYAVTPIAKYQCANAPDSPLTSLTKSNRDKAWVEISKKLLKVDSDPR